MIPNMSVVQQDCGWRSVILPPESPDMIPIENIWAALKHHIRRRVKPRNQEELINGIVEFWNGLTVEQCKKYIDNLYKVVPKVNEKDGNASEL